MFEAGSPILVKRTSGDIEAGWFCCTDFTRTDGTASAYTAPENVAVRVAKPLDPTHTIAYLMAHPEAKFLEKYVSLADLMAWNE